MIIGNQVKELKLKLILSLLDLEFPPILCHDNQSIMYIGENHMRACGDGDRNRNTNKPLAPDATWIK